MGGGIKYRLSPRERTIVADQLGVLEPVRAHVKGAGVDVRLQDPELEISVEDKAGEITYELTYPFDNDAAPANGRFYIKDVFRLNQRDGKLLAFDRLATQSPDINEKVRFWIDLARRDHPRERISSPSGHLDKFLRDMSGAKPELKSPAMKNWLGEALSGLHRPFPSDSKALVDANFAVFAPVRDSLKDLNLRFKFGDPQSGLSIRREKGKLILSLQLVLDSDADSGLESENNGRIYMNDVYEVDAANGKVLQAARGFTPSKTGGPDFDQAYERLNALPALNPALPELKELAAGWLEGLGAVEAKPSKTDSRAEPSDLYGQALWRLYRLTADAPQPHDFLIPNPSAIKKPSGAGLPEDDARRQAMRQLLSLMLSGGDAAALETAGEEYKSDPLFQSLFHLSRNEGAAAERAIHDLPREDELVRHIRGLAKLQARAQRLEEGLPLLEMALHERTQRENREDKAWSKSVGRAFSGESGINPEMRRVAVDGFLRRLRGQLEEKNIGLEAAIRGLEGDGPFEKDVKTLLSEEPALRELVQILDDPDEEMRQESLIHLARRTLKEERNMPATALAIAERYAADNRQAATLKDWLTGQASFGQKFESSLGHFSQEIANPFTLGTMMLAGGASKVGKLAFVNYFGNTSLGLKIGAEAVSVGLEAAVFVGSDKLYRSVFQSPVGVWDRAHLDFGGALLAFGILRGGGIAGRRFQGTLRESEAWQAWLQGRSRIALAARPLGFAEDLLKAEGRAALWKQRAGKVLAWPLRYAKDTGFSRAWLKPSADFAATHGLTLASLMIANSLSRAVGLRPESAQGWKADLVDDALFYGHFYFSGKLMQRLGPSRLDLHLSTLETAGPQVGSRRQAKAGDSPSEPPASPRFRTDALRAWLKNWRESLSGLRWPPWKKAPPAEQPIRTPETLLLPPGRESPSDIHTRETTPPDMRPTIPPSPEPTADGAYLLPTPLESPMRFVPTKAKVHLAVSWTGSHDDRAVLPVSKNTVNYECIFGREELQARPEAVGIDLGFPSTAKGMEAQHAKISYQVKLKLIAVPDNRGVMTTLGIPEKITSTLENLSKASGTFVNGKRVKSTILKSGDLIKFGKDGPGLIFHQSAPDKPPTFTRAIFPFEAARQSWSFGRESFKNGSPDISFPMSSRDISKKQGEILRDALGNFYIQDQGLNQTYVNRASVTGTQLLQNGDVIRFGEGQEFIFRIPSQAQDRPTPPSSISTVPPPEKIPASPPPAKAQTARPENVPLLLTSGSSIPLQVRKSLVLNNEGDSGKLEISAQGENLTVSIPADVGKIAPTKIYLEGDSWRIFRDGEGEVPILVNGLTLPPNIPLRIKPDSELMIGTLRFRVEFP